MPLDPHDEAAVGHPSFSRKPAFRIAIAIVLGIAIGACAGTSVRETPADASANAAASPQEDGQPRHEAPKGSKARPPLDAKASPSTQGVRIHGNTNIEASAENATAVAVGQGNTATTSAGSIKGDATIRGKQRAIVFAAPKAEAPPMARGSDSLSSAGSGSVRPPTSAEGAATARPDSDGRKLENYSVVLAADRQIKIPGPPGEMRVWIGNPRFKPTITGNMQSGESNLPALSDTAKITPFTPGMEVLPKESVCEKIDPTGSEVRFQLKPSAKGTYKVGADVALYSSSDCSGRPIPKTTSTIQVEVTVDTIAEIEQRGDEVAAETWKAFLEFWGKVIALIFALLLFLLRKRLFRLFKFKPKD